MKRFLFLTFSLFMYGCGSSSGDDSKGGGNPPVVPEQPLGESQLVVRVEPDNVKIFAKGDDKHSDHYIEYNLKHINDVVSNADLWRLYELYENKNLQATKPYLFKREYENKPIANAGEWEAAIREVGAGDFIGGYHGDEKLVSVSFSVDGEQKPLFNSEFLAESVGFNQSSNMYSWYSGELIARHEKKYTFTQQGVELYQRIEWVGSVDIDRAYLTMFPIKRKIDYTEGMQVTDTSWHWPSGQIQVVSEAGFSVIVKNDTNEVWLEGAESRFRAEVKMIEHPNLPGYNVFVHNAEAYNKVYFDISGRYKTSIGEVWETKTNYKITTYN